MRSPAAGSAAPAPDPDRHRVRVSPRAGQHRPGHVHPAGLQPGAAHVHNEQAQASRRVLLTAGIVGRVRGYRRLARGHRIRLWQRNDLHAVAEPGELAVEQASVRPDQAEQADRPGGSGSKVADGQAGVQLRWCRVGEVAVIGTDRRVRAVGAEQLGDRRRRGPSLRGPGRRGPRRGLDAAGPDAAGAGTDTLAPSGGRSCSPVRPAICASTQYRRAGPVPRCATAAGNVSRHARL